MKKLFTIGLILFSLASFSQDTTKYYKSHDFGWRWRKGLFTEAFRVPVFTANPSGTFLKGSLYYNTTDDLFYGYNGTAWVALASGGGGGSTDTTSLSNRIDNKVDSVTFGLSEFTDTLKYWIGGDAYTAGYIYKPRGCEDSEGGLVVHRDSLHFDVTAWPLFCVNGRYYTFAGDDIILPDADDEFGKYVAIYVDTLGNAGYIEGTPSANPSLPQVDETYQRLRTYVFIAAGATEPSDVNTGLIYDENTEDWYKTVQGNLGYDTASTVQAFSGTQSIQITDYSNDYLFFVFPGTIEVSAYNTLNFWIRCMTGLQNSQNIRLQFYNGSTAVSNQITITINRSTTQWQLISTSFSKFSFSSRLFDRIRVQFAGNSTGAIYIDQVKLQGGIEQDPGGGGGGTAKGWTAMDTEGNVANIADGGILEFESTNGRASLVITPGTPPKVSLTVNSMEIPLDSIPGLQDLLNAKVDSVTSSNDSLFYWVNGTSYFILEWPRMYFHDEQFLGNGNEEEDPLYVNVRDTTDAPDYAVGYDRSTRRFYSFTWPSSGGEVSSVFDRSGAVTAMEADYSAFYPLLSGSYADPSWITSLAWSKITGAPALFDGDYNSLTNKPTIPTNNNQLTNGEGYIKNITGLVSAGTNVSITGTGVSGDPYVVNAAGGSSGEANTASNVGAGAGVWKDKSGVDLRFRSIKQGAGAIVTQNTDDIEVAFDPTYIAYDTTRTGTYAQRVAIASPFIGQTFFQTNERIGLWIYQNGGWVHHPSYMLLGENTFSASGASGLTSYFSANSGGAADNTNAASFPIDSTHPRSYLIRTGTTTNGIGMFYGSVANNAGYPPMDTASKSRYVIVMRLAITAAPTSADNYRFYWGYGGIGSFPMTNDSTNYGHYFNLAFHRGDGKVQAVSNTPSGGPGSLRTTTTKTLVPNTFYDFVIVCNGYSGDFYINGELVASQYTGGSPLNSSNMFAIINKISGTTQAAVSISRFYAYQTYVQ